MANSGGVTTAMRDCYGPELRRLDAELETVYRKHISGVSDKALMAKSQQAWTFYRKAQCDFEFASAEGGTIEYMLIDGCYQTLTEQRISELQSGMQMHLICNSVPSSEETNSCLSEEVSRRDKDLNSVYRSVMTNNKDVKANLVDAERAWIAFRDANCKFVASERESAPSDAAAMRCVLTMTAAQTETLRPLINPP